MIAESFAEESCKRPHEPEQGHPCEDRSMTAKYKEKKEFLTVLPILLQVKTLASKAPEQLHRTSKARRSFERIEKRCGGVRSAHFEKSWGRNEDIGRKYRKIRRIWMGSDERTGGLMEEIKVYKKETVLEKPLCQIQQDVQSVRYQDYCMNGVTYRVWSAFEGRTDAAESLANLMLRRLESGEEVGEVADEFEEMVRRKEHAVMSK